MTSRLYKNWVKDFGYRLFLRFEGGGGQNRSNFFDVIYGRSYDCKLSVLKHLLWGSSGGIWIFYRYTMKKEKSHLYCMTSLMDDAPEPRYHYVLNSFTLLALIKKNLPDNLSCIGQSDKSAKTSQKSGKKKIWDRKKNWDDKNHRKNESGLCFYKVLQNKQ